MKIIPSYKLVGLILNFEGKVKDTWVEPLFKYVNKEHPDYAIEFRDQWKGMLLELYGDIVEETEYGLKVTDHEKACEEFYDKADSMWILMFENWLEDPEGKY